MRRLRRPRIALPVLRRSAARLLRQFRKDRQAPSQFQGHWRDSAVLGTLLAMHGPVCAWCQRPLGEAGEVEHFRPTSLYWWLAYDFNNYLLSCSTCNQRKAGHFPLLVDWRCTWSERKRLGEEQHVLLDPIGDDVETWLRVKVENKLFLLDAAVHLEDTVEHRRTQATLELFEWNEDLRLIKARREAIQKALEAAEGAVQGNPIRRTEVKLLASRFQPFGVAIRQLLAERHPDLLPTPEEELFLFVKYLADQLALAQGLRQRAPHSNRVVRDESEILWALAVLCKDPPHVTSGEIDRWLERLGCRDQVQDMLARL